MIEDLNKNQEKFSVEFSISSKYLSIHMIQSFIKINPSSSVNRGSSVNKYLLESAYTFWVLESPAQILSSDVNEHFLWLDQALSSSRKDILKLYRLNPHQLEKTCFGIKSAQKQVNIEHGLNHKSLQIITDYKACLSIDISFR